VSPALEQLKDFNAEHPVQQAALGALLNSIEWSQTDKKISLVMGPAGCGKYRLAQLALAELDDPDRQSAILIVASPEVGSRAFSMRQFILALLEVLGDPAPGRHYAHPSQIEELGGRGTTGSAVLIALRNRLRRLRPIAVLIDEANYLASGTPRQVESNIRDLTWLADTCGVPIVLLGTYTVLNLARVGGDTNRRLRVIHHPRYGYTADGVREFSRVIGLFVAELRRLKLADTELDLTSRDGLQKLFAGTEGCVGVLRDWICLAAEIACKQKRSIRVDDFDRTLSSLLADPEDFGQKLLEGEAEAARAHHRNPYALAPHMKTVTKSGSNAKSKGNRTRTNERSTPVGERALGRDAAWGAVLS
jgi:hypothetical protein